MSALRGERVGVFGALVLAVVAGGLSGVGWLVGNPRSEGFSRRGLMTLPAPAQGPVLAASGTDSRAYGVRATRSGFSAVNGAQRLRFSFARSGVLVHSAGWSLSLELAGVGDGGRLQRLDAVTPVARANRVVYAHGGLSEWYVNGPLGLEQGFTVARPIAGAGAAADRGSLTLSLRLGGDLHPAVSGGGHALSFNAPGGGAVLAYRGLVATDARGRPLAARLSLAGGRVQLSVAARDARYPLRIDPLVQVAKLTSFDGGAWDTFSFSVAADGATRRVEPPARGVREYAPKSLPATASSQHGGGPYQPLFGAAYVFAPLTSLVTSLNPDSGPVSGGTTVAINGTNFVPGATVTFGSTPATGVTFVSSTQLTAVAPEGSPGTVYVTVTTPGGTSSKGRGALYAYGPPTIGSFTPASGITGSSVTVTGAAFAPGMVVKFEALKASGVTVVSGTQLKAVVPNGAPGPSTITVSDTQGSATSAAPFTPTFSITGFSPTSGPPGTLVTIEGIGFNAGSITKFRGTTATTSYISPTQVKATIPTGAASGPLTITNTTAPTGTVTSAKQVIVTIGANCSRTSTGLVPLSDLGQGTYKGYEGGLYPGGSDTPPSAYLTAGLAASAQVQPLATDGTPSASGRIVLLSVGMSNTYQEFAQFIKSSATGIVQAGGQTVGGQLNANPQVELVNGATSSWDAKAIVNNQSGYLGILGSDLAASGVTADQVQAVWLKEAVTNENGPFPSDAQNLESDLNSILAMLTANFPNLRVVYLSSRNYGGYAVLSKSPEPYAYEGGFAVQWTVAARVAGDPNARPWVAWGPYLWADGTNPRSDGLVWLCSDFGPDGTHPSGPGAKKVAGMLQSFFTTDPTTQTWFDAPVAPPPGAARTR